MFSIEQLVADCLDAVHDAAEHGGRAVKEVVERSVSEPARIDSVVGSPADQPVFTTWHNSDELTILHVIWPPEVDLFAHDHRMWAAIGLYGGREDNRLFRTLPDGRLEERGEKTLSRGDSILLGDDTVHAVANPSREWTGAIHVYGGDYFASGRHMWPDRDGGAIDFDVTRLQDVLQVAADRATARQSRESRGSS